MILFVKRLHPNARLPTYGSSSAAGLDLYACDDCVIQPGDRLLSLTGIAVELPEGSEGQIRPRSGLASKGVVAVLGTIDSDFRGQLGVLLHNIGSLPYRVGVGDRIAQLVIAPVLSARVVEVTDLRDLGKTERGTGGWGSTGT